MNIMFGFKKKNNVKSESNTILASQSGKIVPISDVPDPVFSEKMLGDGIAILPDENIVLSPVSGTIVNVSDTLHAYCIQTSDDIEILVHIGINTVELKGEGFKSYVKEGDKIKAGDKLATVDLELLKSKNYQIYTPTLITNMDMIEEIVCTDGIAEAGKTAVISYTKK